MAALLRLATKAVPVCFAFFSSIADAQEYIHLLRYFKEKNPLFCFEAPISRVQKLPRWDEKGEPPVSRGKAMEVGAEHLRAAYPGVERFDLHRIDLNRINVRVPAYQGDIWYYLIEYDAIVGGDKRYSATDYVAVVLLDGKPVAKKSGNCTRPW